MNALTLVIIFTGVLCLSIFGYIMYLWAQVKRKKKERQIITPLEKKTFRRAVSVGMVVVGWGVILLVSTLLGSL